MRNAVSALELEVPDAAIEVNNNAVKVWREAADLATKEKVAFVVGNTNGVASVEDNLTVAEIEIIEEALIAHFTP